MADTLKLVAVEAAFYTVTVALVVAGYAIHLAIPMIVLPLVAGAAIGLYLPREH